MKEVLKIITDFYGGISRDDKSTAVGSLSNIEEVDIFSNKDFIQAEKIMSLDTTPTGTELYSFTVDDNDTVYAYGKETTGNKVVIASVANGGSDNPSNFSTLFTSSDSTNLSTTLSPIQYHKTSETNPNYLYYIAGSGSTWVLKRLNLTNLQESTVGTLSGLSGSFDRFFIKRFFGELYIGNGQYIAKVDNDGIFTEKAFTLPNSQVAIDIIPVSDVSIVLSRHKNFRINETIGYWWDLESLYQFDDQFRIPMGGGQWILNWKEKIIIFCAINGVGKFFQLTSPNPGAQVIEIPNRVLTNVGIETSTQPISSPNMVSQKDGILYFGVYKTDKTGIYALGQLDYNSPLALLLSKRFHTTNYANHKPISLFIHGPNFYASFNDNGTNLISRCESNNSPNRSSNAVIETVWIDFSSPTQKKQLTRVYILSKKLPANTSLDLYVATDFDNNTYQQIKRPNDTVFNDANGLFGFFKPSYFNDKLVFKIKVVFTSHGSNSPQLQGIGLRSIIKDME
jgi:hypothetical protein